MTRRAALRALLASLLAFADGCSITPNVTVDKVEVTLCVETIQGRAALVDCDAGAEGEADANH